MKTASKPKSSKPRIDGKAAQATVKRIAGQAAKCDYLAGQMVLANARAKAAKSDYEGAMQELHGMSREPRDMPLLDVGAPAKKDEWRKLTIDKLGLTEKQTESIIEAVKGKTMGHLSDWLTGNEITAIEGFGPAAQEKFDDAMAKFWKDNPQAKD